MGKRLEDELAERLSSLKDPAARRSDTRSNPLSGGWIKTSWVERLSVPLSEFHEALSSLEGQPTEARLLERLGVSPESVTKGTLSFGYGVDPRRSMKQCVHVRYEAVSVDAPDVYLRELALAAVAVQS